MLTVSHPCKRRPHTRGHVKILCIHPQVSVYGESVCKKECVSPYGDSIRATQTIKYLTTQEEETMRVTEPGPSPLGSQLIFPLENHWESMYSAGTSTRMGGVKHKMCRLIQHCPTSAPRTYRVLLTYRMDIISR